MENQKFLFCKHCKNLVAVVNDSNVPIICCGEPMIELVPGSVDASVEKHVPEVKVEGNKITVEVGSVIHPMIKEHYIMWIGLKTSKGFQIKHLTPEDAPKALFEIIDETPEVVYAYCNIHGLWNKEL